MLLQLQEVGWLSQLWEASPHTAASPGSSRLWPRTDGGLLLDSAATGLLLIHKLASEAQGTDPTRKGLCLVTRMSHHNEVLVSHDCVSLMMTTNAHCSQVHRKVTVWYVIELK